ncbi:hypothetical protein D9M71_80310 [compost metagenome]
MNWKEGLSQPGVLAALGATLLFGAGTPLAKLLLNSVTPGCSRAGFVDGGAY